MKFGLERANLTIEDAFSGTVFGVAENRLEILRAIHDAVTPTFVLNASDFRVGGGNVDSLADIRLVVSAFAGSGQVEITPEQCIVSANNIRSASDFEIVRSFAQLLDPAIREFVPLELIEARTVTHHAYLKTDGDFETPEFLRSLVSQSMRDAVPAGARSDFSAELRLSNHDEGWTSRLLLEQAAISDAQLFVLHRTRYADASLGPAEILDDAARRATEQLASLGIDFEADTDA